MKFANGMAGIDWPNVPLPVTLNVREEANVAKLEVSVGGRISSVPRTLFDPVPNQPRSTSSSATVTPDSIENGVRRPSAMPAGPVGRDALWYGIRYGDVLATRAADWNY